MRSRTTWTPTGGSHVKWGPRSRRGAHGTVVVYLPTAQIKPVPVERETRRSEERERAGCRLLPAGYKGAPAMQKGDACAGRRDERGDCGEHAVGNNKKDLLERSIKEERERRYLHANYEAVHGGREEERGGSGSTCHVGQRPPMTWRSAPLTGSVRPPPAGEALSAGDGAMEVEGATAMAHGVRFTLTGRHNCQGLRRGPMHPLPLLRGTRSVGPCFH
jgi:hypothetical protein